MSETQKQQQDVETILRSYYVRNEYGYLRAKGNRSLEDVLERVLEEDPNRDTFVRSTKKKDEFKRLHHHWYGAPREWAPKHIKPIVCLRRDSGAGYDLYHGGQNTDR